MNSAAVAPFVAPSAVAAAAPRPGTGLGTLAALPTVQAATLASTAPPVRMARGQSIQDLVTAVAGPDERLDPELEALLLDMADDFVEQAASFACALAKHRQSTTLDIKDVQLYLQKHCQMRLPGFTVPDGSSSGTSALSGTGGALGAPAPHLGAVSGLQVRSARKGGLYGVGEAHRKRLALIERVKAKEAKRAMAAASSAAAGAAGGADAQTAAAAATGEAKAAGGAAAAAAAKKRKKPDGAQDA